MFRAVFIAGTMLASAPADPGLPPILGVEGTAEAMELEIGRLERRLRERWGGVTTEELTPSPARRERNRAFPILAALREFRERGGYEQVAAVNEISMRLDVASATAFVTGEENSLAQLRIVEDRLAGLDLLPESNFNIDYSNCLRPHEPNPIEVIYLGKLMTLFHLARVGQGECDLALDGFHDQLALAEAFSNEPDTTLQIARRNLDGQALGLLRAILDSCEVDRKKLAGAYFQLTRNRVPISTMELHDFHLFNECNFAYVVAGLGDDDAGETVRRAALAARIRLLEFVSDYAAHAETPRWQRGDPPTMLTWDAAASWSDENESGRPTEDLANQPQKALALLLDLVTESNIGSGLESTDLWESRFELAATAVALALYRTDHEEYPESLELLTPKYLPVLAIDVFTGEPFGYEQRDDGFSLAASEDAQGAWSHRVDSVLDWSMPLGAKEEVPEVNAVGE